ADREDLLAGLRALAAGELATSSAPLSPLHLVRNGLLLASALAGLVAGGGGLPGTAPAGLAIAAAAALVIAVLLIRIDDLIELFAPPAIGGDRARGGTRHGHPGRRSDPGRGAVPPGPAPDVRRHPQAPGAHHPSGRAS
ncbi:hypothetical protein AB0L44_25620, partial [Nonomuraea wenchangensis]|uniref:hypothetical protein n=1 Tax=Nonomuraea wenchangensis TaxID=568860 RepID=UPI00346B3B68